MKNLLATAAVVAVVSTPALAQGGGGMMQRDQTRAEAQQRADMMFQMLDANHDSSVTKDEADQVFAKFQASRGGDSGRGGRTRALIDQAFASTPSLNLQQFEAQALARFDAADANHDGVVTAAERQQARDRQTGVQQTVALKPQ